MRYLEYHNKFEKREKIHYGKIFEKYNKTLTIRERKNFILEAKKSYENLYNENFGNGKKNDIIILIESE